MLLHVFVVGYFIFSVSQHALVTFIQQTSMYQYTLTENLHRVAEDKQETVGSSSTEPKDVCEYNEKEGENLESERRLFIDERSCMSEQLQRGKYVDVQGIQGGSVPTESTASDNQEIQKRAQMKSEQLTMTLDDIHASDYMKLIKVQEATCDDDDYQSLLTRGSPSDDHEPDYDYTSSLENIYQPLLMENDTKGSRDSIYQALFSGPDPQT